MNKDSRFKIQGLTNLSKDQNLMMYIQLTLGISKLFSFFYRLLENSTNLMALQYFFEDID